MELFLIVDESGAKKKSNKEESYPREFGLMAGFILYEEGYQLFKQKAKDIIYNFEIQGIKPHLTDLPFEIKNKLLQDFFGFFSENPISWLYSAIYTQGFYKFHKSIYKDDNNPKIHNMHAALFKENLMKAIAFIKDNFKDDSNEIKLTVVTDNVSPGILKGFYQEFDELKPYLKTGKKSIRRDIYNKHQGKLTPYEFSFSIDNDAYSQFQLEEINLEIIIDNDAAFFADILNNTLYNHIRNHIKFKNHDEKILLNSREVISDYKLFKTCYGYSTDEITLFSDIAYHYN